MMKRKMKVLNGKVFLERRIPKHGEKIAWEVYIGNKSYGIIVQRSNHWYPKFVGWQAFSVKFWIGYNMYERIVVGFRRDDVIEQLIMIRGKNEKDTKAEAT